MSIEPTRSPAVPAPGRLGQGTAIEQSRAAAEVHARVVVAQQVPRNIDTAHREMRSSCDRPGLAEQAFYKYVRGGKTVTGASVHLARELARCWGNVDYGISELRRDDEAGQSEMLAWAWDLQTNTRSGQIFIVPHGRDTRQGRQPLVDLRDIYENNANQGARRLRESIFAILPPWFTEEAKEACAATLKRGDGTPLAERVAKAIAWFGELGVREKQLVQKVGRPSSAWTDLDLAQLLVAGRSLQRGEVTRDEEFGTEGVTRAEIAAQATPPAAEPVDPREANGVQADPADDPEAREILATLDAGDGWPEAAQPPDAKPKRGRS